MRPELSRARKLSEDQKKEILKLKGLQTQTSVANQYGVHRSSIAFIWYPERLEKQKKYQKDNPPVVSKEKRRAASKRHRQYVKSLKEQGLL